jgi:hypothetical protein
MANTESVQNLWSITDVNIMKSLIWPLLLNDEGFSACKVNRSTSSDRDMWKVVKHAQFTSSHKQLIDYQHENTGKHHDPRRRILTLWLHTSDDIALWAMLPTVIADFVYLTELTLCWWSKMLYPPQEVPNATLFDGLTRSGGPLSRLPSLKRLCMENWPHMIEANSLSRSLECFTLVECRRLQAGCIPDSLIMLNLKGAEYHYKTWTPYPLDAGVVPNTLRQLKLSSDGGIGWDNAPDIFPNQLEYLSIQLWDDDIPDRVVFPASLKVLSAFGADSCFNSMSFYHAFPPESQIQIIYCSSASEHSPDSDDGFRLPSFLSHVQVLDTRFDPHFYH